MANQVRGKPYGGALCGHYMRRVFFYLKKSSCFIIKAGTLRQEHLRLTYQCDRLNAWNCPNDCFIDLHGMNWKRAIEFVKYKVDLCKGLKFFIFFKFKNIGPSLNYKTNQLFNEELV
jgi:ribosomal protein L34E